MHDLKWQINSTRIVGLGTHAHHKSLTFLSRAHKSKVVVALCPGQYATVSQPHCVGSDTSAHQCVGKYQSCMVQNRRLYPHASYVKETELAPARLKNSFSRRCWCLSDRFLIAVPTDCKQPLVKLTPHCYGCVWIVL